MEIERDPRRLDINEVNVMTPSGNCRKELSVRPSLLHGSTRISVR